MDMHRVFVPGKALGLGAFTALAVLTVACGTAFAQQGTSPGSEGSIFTPPANSAEPGFQGGGFHKRAHGNKGFNHGGKGRNGKMGFHQIQMLPSLTPTQRQELRTIFKASRAEIQPDIQQIMEMKAQFKGRGPDGLSAENKEKFQAIKARLKAKRASTLEKMKAKLTPEQIGELEKMREGSLTPPGLRDANQG